ncbi:MAG: FHA domain-containing protein [Acidimicrobiia bacterium]|nr:FHA domain-containing protein [Acidimicrobiia bacterium]
MQINSSNDHSGAGSVPTVTVWVDGQAFHGLDGHTLGRDHAASITVDHAQVSRRHAALKFDGRSWAVHDLGSTNGLHDQTGRHPVVALPAGRTPVWFGPPESSPCVYFDIEAIEPASAPQPGPAGAATAPPTRLSGQNPVATPPAPSAQQAPPGGAPASRSAPPPPPASVPGPDNGPQPFRSEPGTPVAGSPRSVPPPPTPSAQWAPPQFADPARRAAPETHHRPPPPPAVSLNTAGLEQNIGELSQVIQPRNSQLIIGRAAGCDISIPDPLVSRKHARLLLNEGGGRIIDLGSDNGTFVNGQRIVDSPIVEGDLVELGKAQFVLTGGRLQQHVAHGLPLQAENLTVTVAGDLVLLSDVSFTLPAGSMTAVIGPSGCGKSTLLNALTGQRPANTGRVLLGGRDLYASDEGLGRRIGFVPQDDPVHESLSVRHALTAAAKLRLPADTTAAEIKSDVEQVAGELGLAQRLDTKVKALSGGQRKRVSVGYELVGEPQALILDEPTSGLDPGLERELMGSLRQLADKGTTTIVVTHSVQSVELCDLVLVLAPGGRLAFIGPPSKVAQHFRCSDLASVFTLLGTRERAEWELEFAQTTSYLKFGASAPPATAAPSTPLPPRSFFHDLKVMIVRYVRQLIGDKRRLLLLLLQAPLLGLLLSLVLFRDAFGPEAGPSATRQYLLATVLAMTWLGGSNSVREIVQERDVFRREWAVGVSATAQVLSKWLVLGFATIVQAVVLHLVASTRQLDSIDSGALLANGEIELILALAGIGVASVGVGLLISALVDDTAKALTMLPLVIIPVLLLSGLVVPTAGRAGVQELTYLNPVQWGGSAAAVAVDLRNSEGCNLPGGGPAGDADAPLNLPGGAGEACDNPRWERSMSTQTVNFVLLVAWSLGLLFLAAAAARWSMGRPLRRG